MIEPLTSTFVALDIALLLSPKLDELCRRINTAPGAKPFSDFRKQDNYPHITLARGVFREEEIPALSKDIRLYKPHFLGEVVITELYPKTSEQIGQEYQLRVKKDEQFDELYRAFIERIKPYSTTFPASREMIVVDQDEIWNPATIDWVNEFRNKKPEDYNPHISLKCRHASLDVQLPLEGIAERIVIANVGNYCSCRGIRRELHR
jgi:hypothetical protein